MNEWMDEWMNEWMNELMNGWMSLLLEGNYRVAVFMRLVIMNEWMN